MRHVVFRNLGAYIAYFVISFLGRNGEHNPWSHIDEETWQDLPCTGRDYDWKFAGTRDFSSQHSRKQLRHLSMPSSAADLTLTGTTMYERMTPVLPLHTPLQSCMWPALVTTVKVAVMIYRYKCLHGLAPLPTWRSTVYRRHPSSLTCDLQPTVPRTTTIYWDRSFSSVHGHVVWNSVIQLWSIDISSDKDCKKHYSFTFARKSAFVALRVFSI